MANYTIERSNQGWHQELKRDGHVTLTGTKVQMDAEKTYQIEEDRLKTLSPGDRLTHHLKNYVPNRQY